MAQFANYLIEDQLYESSRSIVYRGRLLDDPQTYILKVLQPAQAMPESLARFRREFDLTKNFSNGRVIQALDLVEDNSTLAIVLEDIGGVSLAQNVKDNQLNITTFLPLAIEICNGLAAIHQQNLIHKDINPANIVWNQHTDLVKIIDFGLATTLPRENPEIRNPNVLEGTLAYISPEQTGRMNRSMDYRSDFYSLGVTFYQLLTGKLPFTTDDALELVHAHIARRPIPPHEVNDNIPSILSDIVMRLLAKNAEDRYQSAFGLKADLEACGQQWQTTHKIIPFPLGLKDANPRFQLPQKLYGREQQVDQLHHQFNKVIDPNHGNIQLMLVTGAAGIGKSALVQELFKPVTSSRGTFISGKFDQLQNVPYAPLLQAFNTLLNQILTASEAEIERWREKLWEALGVNGQIMVEVLPTLELIIGPQTAVPELLPAEAENRFNLTFQKFIHVFAQAEHPLVLFLDDWQWMDGSSRQFLQNLLTAGNTNHLLLIGAFRDKELSMSHPVQLMIDKVAAAGTAVTTIHLDTLQLNDVNQFIADTLTTDTSSTADLAQLLLSKTDGNPFFLGEFTKSLYAEELLTFNFNDGRWEWQTEQIQTQEITDNVVSLMMANIQKLAPPTQTALTIAACIGNSFDLNTLAHVHGQSTRLTAVDLWPAINNRFIIPLTDSYKLAEYDLDLHVVYKFAHDRIQQAAYALIPLAKQQEIHSQIGTYLLQTQTEENDDGRIFEIVNHLNLGQDLRRSDHEIWELANLNLQASQTAIDTAAFQAAYSFSQTGVQLINKTAAPWQTHYHQTLAIYTTAVKTAFQSANYEQMDALAATALEHAQTLLDKTPIYTNIFYAYLAQNRISETVDKALPVLKELGVNLPANPTNRHLLTALAKTNFTLRGTTTEDLLHLPSMTDKTKIASMEILSSVAGAAYFTKPQLFALMVFQLVQHFAKYGNHPFATRTYAAYGLMQAGFLNNVEKGVSFGQLGLELVQKLNAKEQYSQTAQLYYHYLSHWQEHIRASLEPMQNAYQIALETGNLTQATYCAYSYSTHAIYAGEPLNRLIPEMEQYSSAMLQMNQDKIRYVQLMFLQFIANLNRFSTEDICKIDGKYFNEAEGIAAYKEANDQPAYCTFLTQKGTLLFLFGQYKEAQKVFEEVESLIESVAASFMVSFISFLIALVHVRLLESEPENKKVYMKRIAAHQKKLKGWADSAPMNFQHKYDLVTAELCRVEGDHRHARFLYEKAINGADDNRFIQEKALGHELAGRYYEERENGRLAKYHLKQAHHSYVLWGANAKAKDIENRYPQYFVKESYQPGTLQETQRSTPSSSTISSTNVSTTAVLDLSSVIKASQALSGEIKIDELLNSLMTLAIENAGAQAGYLLLLHEEQWQIAACGGDASAETALPSSVLNYVSRSRETIVLDDAASSSQFSQDPVILKKQPKSILCLPLIHHREVVGILYLENNLTSGAFTQDRLSVLNLLASQAAISIENARLVAQLEDYGRTLEAQVAQRTSELSQVNHQAQKALAEAERANENKSIFLSNMSRELRTPLNTIIGFTRLVKQRGEDNLPEKQINNLNKVLVSADHLLGLINTVIDIAKIEAGGMDVQLTSFDAQELVEGCLATTQPLLKKGVVLKTEFDENLPTIHSDPAKIKQIIINLLSNAAKFTHEGEIFVSAKQANDNLIISVQDSGIGIAEEALERIFDEFEQAESTTRQNYGGTGLGLPISLGLARLLGGDLTAVSQLGQGATFTLTLPTYYTNDDKR